MAANSPPTRLHTILGVITFLVWISLTALSMLPQYQLSRTGSILLMVAFMTLIGFGTLIERFLQVYSGGAPPPRQPQKTPRDEGDKE